MSAPSDSPDEPAALVMAMPRRELFSVNGFVQQMEMRVIESLADEAWFARPEIIAEDIEAKEVRLGLLIRRGDQVLMHEEGVVLHACPVPAEIGNLAPGVRGLREMARAAGHQLTGAGEVAVELIGYLNDDSLEEVRPYLVMVYEVRVASTVDAPSGYVWMSPTRLRDVALDPVSSLVVPSVEEDRLSGDDEGTG